MNYIFRTAYCLLPIISLSAINSINPIRPKLCVNCKHFTNNFFDNNKFGKCLLFPRDNPNDYYLVNGNKHSNHADYYYCSTARKCEDMCGKEGKLYEKK